MDEIMTIPEVARYLKISKSKIYLLVTQRAIPYIRIGKNVRVKRVDLERWIEEKKSEV